MEGFIFGLILGAVVTALVLSKDVREGFKDLVVKIYEKLFKKTKKDEPTNTTSVNGNDGGKIGNENEEPKDKDIKEQDEDCERPY